MQTFLFRLIISISLLALPFLACTQHYNLPLDRYSRLFLLRSDSSHFGSFQGQPLSWLSLDTIKGFEPEKRYSVGGRKLFDDHLINVNEKDFKLHIDLLVHFELGEEVKLDNAYHQDTRMSRNLRGFLVRGDLGNKVSFETSFREQQSFVPYYLYNYSERTLVMPGNGRIKVFDEVGRDHSIAEGYLAYAPANWVNIQFGTQKNFIGSGYRSLLLSDNSFTYPQLKASFDLLRGKLKYHLIHAWMQTLQRLPSGDTPESLFIKKNGSFKYLEFNPIPQISLALFEAVMWNRFDPIKGTVSLDGMAYSPLIGTSAIALGLNDTENNALLGLDLSLRPIYEVLVYGQLIVDREERTGHQIGARTIDLGVQGLSIRAEYNSVEPFTYSNEIARQNYGHFAQAIAHPMGAGFDEVSLGVTYFYNRWFMDAAYVRADQLIDPINEENYCAAGGDIFSTTQCTNEVELNAYQAELNHFEMRLGRMFNPNSNFNAYLGWLFRERSGAQSTQSQSMFSFGVEMSLYNRYEDF